MSNAWMTGNFLLAQGVECESGTQQYANADFWRAIDPQKRFEGQWNRYGHRNISLSTNGVCEVSASGDVIRFSVTERALRDLGVKHLVWSGRKLHEPWLRYEGRSRLHFVHTLLPEDSAPTGETCGGAAPPLSSPMP